MLQLFTKMKNNISSLIFKLKIKLFLNFLEKINQVNLPDRKIPFDIHIILKVASLASGIFLLGGYIYNKVFLYYFDIDSTLYFSLSDYIASSLNHITIVILNIFLLLATYFFSKARFTKKHFESGQRILLPMLCIFSIGILIIPYTPIEKYFNFLVNEFYSQLFCVLGIWVTVITFFFLPLICKKVFNNHLAALSTIFFIINFPLMVACNALQTADYYKYEKINTPYKSIHLIGLKLPNEQKLKVILANSNYYFLLNNETKKIIVYPKDKVEYVEIE